jgi:hypothetical protein
MSEGSSRNRPLVFNDGVKRRKPITYEITETGCWHCTSHKANDGRGYTQIRVNGVLERLHQHSYRVHKGKIGKLVIMHLCDNPKCFNPDHLETGTQKQNMYDMMKKGRNAYIGVRGSRKL